jgi:UDPglucose 6-dehydrogenase
MKISVFGTGYVGLVTGACLSNLGHHVLCIDIDEEKIERLLNGEIPFYEPGLLELVRRNQEKNRLRFSTSPQEAVEYASVIFNCVGTPQSEDGSADLTYVFNVARNVAEFANGPKTLINKSTVPPGTAHNSAEVIKAVDTEHPIDVVSNPEFLAEGKAIHDFTHPDKIVVGAKNDRSFSLLRKVYTGRVRTYIPLIETDWETAEMIKYANNSFLATKISFINEMANICDHVGADVRLISQAIGMDYRICAKFLNPGVGYGGSCFPKDVRALILTARANG